MEFLWVLLILFIICPPAAAIIGVLVGLVGMIAAPFLLWGAYRSYRSMYHNDDDNDKF